MFQNVNSSGLSVVRFSLLFTVVKLDIKKRDRTWCKYHNLQDLTTPIEVSVLTRLLEESNYDSDETNFIINGFTEGFDVGYRGPTLRQDTSNNIPFTVGDEYDMWEKLMKEIKMKRVAGPYEEIPYKNYMQSPIGLVPKAGNKTRLIFHLSYEFKSGLGSLNANTPKEMCSVKYNDLDFAVKACLQLLSNNQTNNPNGILFYSKSDLVSAFRILPLKPNHSRWLIMAAKDPWTNKKYFFVEKNLPFGSSISCSHFQRISNCLRHITMNLMKKKNLEDQGITTNYLDDFLFIATEQQVCDGMLTTFIEMCADICFPVAMDKTEYATSQIVFLGIILDGVRHLLVIPEEKRIKALNLLLWIESKPKTTVRSLQQLAGILNFLHKAIVPGRVFTRRMYSKFSHIMDSKGKLLVGSKIKPYHHIKLDREFRDDCEVWKVFLNNSTSSLLCRPFVDVEAMEYATELGFTSDAAANEMLGFGCVYGNSFCYGKWPESFIKTQNPSIQFLELFGLVAAVFVWSEKLQNSRSIIFCDNDAVVKMVNKSASSCRHCMYLLRLLVLRCLQYNMRIFTKHIFGHKNVLADDLSRLNLDSFRKTASPEMAKIPEPIPEMLWPIDKVWKIY